MRKVMLSPIGLVELERTGPVLCPSCRGEAKVLKNVMSWDYYCFSCDDWLDNISKKRRV